MGLWMHLGGLLSTQEARVHGCTLHVYHFLNVDHYFLVNALVHFYPEKQ